jgi:hypothetical protein
MINSDVIGMESDRISTFKEGLRWKSVQDGDVLVGFQN